MKLIYASFGSRENFFFFLLNVSWIIVVISPVSPLVVFRSGNLNSLKFLDSNVCLPFSFASESKWIIYFIFHLRSFYSTLIVFEMIFSSPIVWLRCSFINTTSSKIKL